MHHFLPKPIIGIISLFLYGTFILSLGILSLIFALIRLIPIKPLKKWINHHLHRIPSYWAAGVGLIMTLGGKIKWDVTGIENLSEREWYLLIANHRSWADILVLNKVFHRKIPSLRFFMKKQLLWQLPLVGYACKILGCPIMEHHPKSYFEQHPELKNKDIETTRAACEKFRNIPITMINFVEGGRFNDQKHTKQESPYRYLLKPKAGGIAFVLATMGSYLHKILNVTIIYPDMKVSFWDFACGRIDKITVRVQTLPIAKELLGDYHNDAHFRSFFQFWVNELWMEKDKLIVNTLQQRTVTSDDGDSDSELPNEYEVSS